MKSINFDNPYLLLIAIPALALVLVPFFIAIRKENSSRSVITSLILHVLMVVTVTLGVAGMNVQTVVTQTQVVVVADVSYSASKDFDVVDDYVRGVRDGLPMNSQMGVVVFGRDYQLKTPLGAEFDTVSGSTVDDSATNIAGDVVDIATGALGEFVDGTKDVAATVTNAIADGAQAAWDWISFWD